MPYNNFTLTVAPRQQTNYALSAEAEGLGRVTASLPLLAKGFWDTLGAVPQPPDKATDLAPLRLAGAALFRWLFPDEVETHLRVAWDRAERLGRGLRVRLCLDAPEINALPWELLYDPRRDHFFATSISTPLVRYLDQVAQFGPLTEQKTDWPVEFLLILPAAPDLSLAQEHVAIADVIAGLPDLARLRVLDGAVTRQALSDALLEEKCAILHFSGHGAFVNGTGYVALNGSDGKPDVVDGDGFSRLLDNHHSLRLVVLNACSVGRVDRGQPFAGLGPQLARRGVPAVIAMQFPVVDQEAATFAREFYQQLCTGENAGQVDVALAHARTCCTCSTRVAQAGPPRCCTPTLPTASFSTCRSWSPTRVGPTRREPP